MVVGTLSLVQKGQIVFTVHSISCIRNDNVPTTTASTASIGLTFLHQRQCFHHHLPLFYCVHLFDLFAPKTMSPPPYTTISLCLLHPLCTLSTVSTVPTAYYIHCIHCIHCVHCLLHPLPTASTAYCINCLLCPQI